jgi:Fe-S oxidoreductase
VTVLEATLLLTPALAERALVVVRCADICVAGDHVPWILEHRPVGLEVVDHQLLAALDHADEDGAWLLVEFGADTRTEAEEQARAFCVDARRQGVPDDDLRLFDDREEERRLWAVREAGLAATAFPGDGRDYWPGWEDSAVPPARIGDYLRDLKALYRSHGLRGAMYGHIGQGCIHSRIDFDLRSERGIAVFRRFVEDAADLVVSYGGVLSGEHGDGQARAELLDRVYGTELVEAFRAFKRIWDPDWRMNPGKVVDPYPLDANLKLGAGYAPWRPRVAFAYPEDGGDFAHATVRCVGVGACRKPDGADVMCPSFVATREELHTTRGRARLLFELLEGELVTDGWRSREVEEALDLCLACKGCTNDCPVGVDMPTYKAEFLHHHRRGRLRPRHAYAFGLIDQAARVGSLAPGVTNRFAGSALGKRLAGIAPERDVPRFARTTLQRWWRDRGGTRNPDGHRVVLWPDTFTNRFHPEVGIAAVEAIESAGWQVVLPRGHVCCGRPLYDYGFLVLARRYLRRTLRQLGPELAQGTPVVGIEPSCVAVFKDELPKLLPDEPGAARLAERAHHFAEFFERYELDVPERGGRVLLWGHCHQKATGGMDAERALLARAGVESELLQAGCCGLAGSWGFEAGHYELSQQIGEHGLLPAVRALPAGDLLVADGFSCRTQVEQATGRRPLHVAELLVSERASLSERQA